MILIDTNIPLRIGENQRGRESGVFDRHLLIKDSRPPTPDLST